MIRTVLESRETRTIRRAHTALVIFVGVLGASLGVACVGSGGEACGQSLVNFTSFTQKEDRIAYGLASGHVGTWDTRTDQTRLERVGLRDVRALDLLPDSKHLFVAGLPSRPHDDDWSQMSFMLLDPDSFEIKSLVWGPTGERPCWVEPGLVALIAQRGEDARESSPLSFWKVSANTMQRVCTLVHPEGKYTVFDVRATSGGGVLCALGLLSDDESSAIRTRELLLFDVQAKKISQRVPTDATLRGWSCLAVGAGDKYAIVHEPGRIELYELPDLRRLNAIELHEPHSAVRAAVTADGRCIAFGDQRLELWTLEDQKIYLLDELRERIVLHNEAVSQKRWPTEESETRLAFCLADLDFRAATHELVSVTRAGEASIWDVDARRRLHRKALVDIPELLRIEGKFGYR